MKRYLDDQFIDFQNNRLSHWLALLSWPRESYGFDNGKWGGWLTDKIKNDVTAIGPVEHQFRILKMLGINYNKNAQLGSGSAMDVSRTPLKIFASQAKARST